MSFNCPSVFKNVAVCKLEGGLLDREELRSAFLELHTISDKFSLALRRLNHRKPLTFIGNLISQQDQISTCSSFGGLPKENWWNVSEEVFETILNKIMKNSSQCIVVCRFHLHILLFGKNKKIPLFPIRVSDFLWFNLLRTRLNLSDTV
jgi:hypothetical protein